MKNECIETLKYPFVRRCLKWHLYKIDYKKSIKKIEFDCVMKIHCKISGAVMT